MTRSHARFVTPITPGQRSNAPSLGFAFCFWTPIRMLMLIALPAFLFNPTGELPAQTTTTNTPGATVVQSVPAPTPATATVTNTSPTLAADLPDMGSSVLRLFGSLALVLGLFLGGVYVFRNWQRLALQKNGGAHLRIQEIKPLGNRHALYLVQCDQQRMLLASSPNGINFITHVETPEEAASVPSQKAKEGEPFLRALNKAEGAGS